MVNVLVSVRPIGKEDPSWHYCCSILLSNRIRRKPVASPRASRVKSVRAPCLASSDHPTGHSIQLVPPPLIWLAFVVGGLHNLITWKVTIWIATFYGSNPTVNSPVYSSMTVSSQAETTRPTPFRQQQHNLIDALRPSSPSSTNNRQDNQIKTTMFKLGLIICKSLAMSKTPRVSEPKRGPWVAVGLRPAARGLWPTPLWSRAISGSSSSNSRKHFMRAEWKILFIYWSSESMLRSRRECANIPIPNKYVIWKQI